MNSAVRRPIPNAPFAAAERGQRTWILLVELAQAVTDAVMARLGSGEHVNNADVSVICRLAIAGSLRPRDLAGSSGLSSGGMTKLLDRLEQLGIVERSVRQVRTDRRAILISLTREGQQVATAMGQGVEDARDRIREFVAAVSTLLDAGPDESSRPSHSAVRPRRPVASSHEPGASSSAGTAVRGQRILTNLIDLGRDAGDAIAARLDSREHVNNADVSVICRLAIAGSLRPRDLAGSSGLSSGGMTKLLDRLEQLGIVERSVRQVRTDRRAILISLTREGQQVATAMGQGVEDARDRIREFVAAVSGPVDA